MEKMKTYTFEELLDSHFGKEGTPRRDEHEREVAEALRAYEIGEAIKKARLQQHLTQEELGEKVGLKKSRISRMERGNGITLPTLSRVFNALGIQVSLTMQGVGEVSLC